MAHYKIKDMAKYRIPISGLKYYINAVVSPGTATLMKWTSH